MKTISDISKLQHISSELHKKNKTIGFIPTMGALHAGHLKLIRKSKAKNNVTIVSIFVNPTQFSPNEDLKKSILVIGERGVGKQVNLKNFNDQHRGGKGVKIAPAGTSMGRVAFAQIIEPEDSTVIITSQQGQIVKTLINKIPKYSRTAKGVILMRFSKPGDQVVSATFI